MNNTLESLYICDFSFVRYKKNLEFYERILSGMDDHLIKKFSKKFIFFIYLIISFISHQFYFFG